jgi:NurA-like 5'-3' nuclease
MKLIIIYFVIIFLLCLIGCRESIIEPDEIKEDVSDVDFPLTKIYSPAYLEKFSPGSILNIRWEPVNSSNELKIELYRKTTFQRTIIESTQDNGSFDWFIPTQIDHSRHYRVKITNLNNASQSLISDDFYIQN